MLHLKLIPRELFCKMLLFCYLKWRSGETDQQLKILSLKVPLQTIILTQHFRDLPATRLLLLCADVAEAFLCKT